MRPKSILLLALALGCGLIASWGISDVMERNANREQAPPEETEDIYVALKDINVNEALTPELVKLDKWPKVKVPRDAMRTLEEVEGRRAGQKIYSGEPIIASRLINANSSAADQLPKGYRPFPIRVNAETSAAGLIKPGDNVDVQLFVKRNPALGIEETKTQTIMSNIRVFAIDQQYQRGTDEEEGHVIASTVSLVVTSEQANKLALAQRIGEMSLMLRHPEDDQLADGEDTASVEELFGLEKGDREAERGDSVSAADEILNQLKAIKDQAQATVADAVIVEEVPPPPHQLMLLRGSDVEVIEFGIDGNLPSNISAVKATNLSSQHKLAPALGHDAGTASQIDNAPAIAPEQDDAVPQKQRETNGDAAPPVDLDDLSNLDLGVE